MIQVWQKRLAAVSGLLLLGLITLPSTLQDAVDTPLQDLLTRHQLVAPGHPDPRIIIVDIDETAMQQEGRWPWPRSRTAELILQLHQHYDTTLIGIDILFVDQSEETNQLAAAIHQSNATTATVWQTDPQPISLGDLILPSTCNQCDALPQIGSWLQNLPELSAAETGHISPEIDADGILRRIAPLACQQNQCLEMLALSLYRQLLRVDASYQLTPPESFLSPHLLLKSHDTALSLPLDANGRLIMPWHHPSGAFAHISAAEILNQQAPKTLLQGRIALIGSTATTLYDQVATPIDPRFPAVELHARLLAALLDHQLPYMPRNAALISLIFSATILLLLTLTGLRQQLLIGSITALFLCILWTLLWISLRQKLIYWPIAQPWLTLVSSLLLLYPVALYAAHQRRTQVETLFKSYVHPAVLERLINTPDNVIGIAPERKEITILFADICRFSRYADEVTPETLAATTNDIMNRLTDVIHRHHGTVDKYMGDGIMAFWGAPLPDPNQADHAVAAAKELVHTMHTFSQQTGRPELPISIGINSGTVVVGDMGSDVRRSYTVLGAAVNLAAHLEAATRQYNTPILIGAATQTRLKRLQLTQALTLHLENHKDKIIAYPYNPD